MTIWDEMKNEYENESCADIDCEGSLIVAWHAPYITALCQKCGLEVDEIEPNARNEAAIRY